MKSLLKFLFPNIANFFKATEYPLVSDRAKKIADKIGWDKLYKKAKEAQKNGTSTIKVNKSMVEKDLLSQLDRQTKEISDMINSALVNVTRLEVIDHQTLETGRVYVKKDCEKVELSLQDFGKTLKIFISKKD